MYLYVIHTYIHICLDTCTNIYTCAYKCRDRCVNTYEYIHVCSLCKISGTQIYLCRDKVYVQRMTDVQYIAIIKANTTTMLVMIMMTKLAYGMGLVC